MFSIYSLSPAPWGDSYRLVEMFDTEDDAKEVLASLEKVNILFNCYKIVQEDHVQTNKQLQLENKQLRNTLVNTRLSNSQGWRDLQIENTKQKERIEKLEAEREKTDVR